MTPLFDCSTVMGRLMAGHDWTTSPLGAPDAWPVELRLAVRTLLTSREPRSISWGPRLAMLYNDAYAEMMDARHPAALGRPLPEVWREVWPLIEADVSAALGGVGSFRQSVPLVRLEQGVMVQRWHHYGYSPLFGQAGEVLGIQCLSLNVTDRVSAEALRERELQSLRELFAASPGFAAVLQGPDFIFELANPAYEALVGRTHLVGRPLRDVLPELVDQGYLQLLERVLRSGEAYTGVAMPLHLNDRDRVASERFVDFVFQPIHDGSGQVDRIFVQGSEVTDREQALRALRVESANKDGFLALLAHELRNPLAPIASAADILCAGGGGEAAVPVGAVIQRQARLLGRIVGDLFDVSRASRGSFHLERSPVDLGTVLAHALDQVTPLTDAKRQHLQVTRSATPLWVEGDASRLTQVLSNLLVNASRYTQEGGRVEVSLVRDGRHAAVTVADNGRGIEPYLLPRIFELFTLAGESARSRGGGLGLGLPLVRRLVELHGGEV